MKMSSPLVSVIIPVYNTGKVAKKVISQLLKQSYQNIEIVVIDDGSTDGSLARLQEIAARERRVRLFHQKNAGVSAARNAGIERARGEYMVFVDSDDEVRPGFIEKLVEAMADDGVSVALTGKVHQNLQDEKRTKVVAKPRRERKKHEKLANYMMYLLLRDGRMYSVTNKIFRADVVRKLGLEFEEGRDFAEDTKFVLDYLQFQPGEIRFIPEALYIYKFGTETSIVRGAATKWENWQKSYDDLKEWVHETDGGGFRSWILLKLVRARWKVSHVRSKKRARKAETGSGSASAIVEKGVEKPVEKSERHAMKYVLVGVIITLFDFVAYTVLVKLVFRTNDALEISTAVATVLATILAYILHSRITWRDRKPAKFGVVKFFLWNGLAAVALKPFTAWVVGTWTGLFQFALMVSEWLRLPFDYGTIEYLGVYGIATLVIMVLNYFFYDRLVFGSKKKTVKTGEMAQEEGAGKTA